MKRRTKYSAPKMGLPFGIGILYLMVHIPFVVFWKIGITGVRVGAAARARQVGKAVFGFPVPVLFVPVPFCYHIEQWLHGMLRPLNVSFYKGDGHTEFFWFPAAIFAAAIIVLIYCAYWVLAVYLFEHFHVLV